MPPDQLNCIVPWLPIVIVVGTPSDPVSGGIVVETDDVEDIDVDVVAVVNVLVDVEGLFCAFTLIESRRTRIKESL
jgi:hypothetical protein